MASRSCVRQEIATTDPEVFIEVKVRYAGKPEYYGAEQQGYWVSVLPVRRREVVDGDVTLVIRTVGGFTGIKRFLEPATRYSEKKLRDIELDQEWIDGWVDNKLFNMGLERKEAANV